MNEDDVVLVVSTDLVDAFVKSFAIYGYVFETIKQRELAPYFWEGNKAWMIPGRAIHITSLSAPDSIISTVAHSSLEATLDELAQSYLERLI